MSDLHEFINDFTDYLVYHKELDINEFENLSKEELKQIWDEFCQYRSSST